VAGFFDAAAARLMSKILPPTYFLAAIALTMVLHFLAPLGAPIPFAWRFTGLLPITAGIVLNVAADRQFKRLRTTVKPFQTSTALATDGVFRLTRNPMYLGMVLIIAGIALLEGTITPWLVVAALAVVLDRLFIAPEETMLKKTFGYAFQQYCQRVRRWL
jgi:protein-S-isoprenylcysteine O-methyltransferase Ste14